MHTMVIVECAVKKLDKLVAKTRLTGLNETGADIHTQG